jgi:hypothetical protein
VLILLLRIPSRHLLPICQPGGVVTGCERLNRKSASTTTAVPVSTASTDGYPLPHERGSLFFLSAPQVISPPLDPDSVDHQQIALAQRLVQENGGRICVLVTRDRGMADIGGSAHSFRPSCPAAP